MCSVSDRLREAMRLRGLKQTDLVIKTGIGKSSISTYLAGSYVPKQSNLYKLAKALSVNPAWLMGEDAPMNDTDSIFRSEQAPPLPDGLIPIDQLPRHRVPLIGSVAAGEPIIADPEYDVYVDAPSKADFALTVQGDSMEPLYLDGDVVYIRSQPDVDDGQPAVVLIDDSAVVKRIYHMPGGLTLISENSKYPPRNITQDNCDVLRILGAIVGYTRMYRRKD